MRRIPDPWTNRRDGQAKTDPRRRMVALLRGDDAAGIPDLAFDGAAKDSAQYELFEIELSDPDQAGEPHGETPEPATAGRAHGLVRRWLSIRPRVGRLDPGRAGALAMAAVAVIATGAAAIGVWLDRPVTEPAPLPVAATQSSVSSHGVQLVISVIGRVARPGLVQLPEGSRVADALRAAGGALPDTDLSTLNPARRLADGEQLHVGIPPPAVDNPGQGPTAPPGKVNLNAASVEQLDALPGVGQVTARRIVEWRTRNGHFSSIEQLREIEGIGQSRLVRLRELVTV